jgi:hypothetical protein
MMRKPRVSIELSSNKEDEKRVYYFIWDSYSSHCKDYKEYQEWFGIEMNRYIPRYKVTPKN